MHASLHVRSTEWDTWIVCHLLAEFRAGLTARRPIGGWPRLEGASAGLDLFTMGPRTLFPPPPNAHHSLPAASQLPASDVPSSDSEPLLFLSLFHLAHTSSSSSPPPQPTAPPLSPPATGPSPCGPPTMLTTRATSATAGSALARGGRRALAATGRRANMSRLHTPHTPMSLALSTIGVPSAIALGLRNFPAARFYATSTQTSTTTTSTPPPPPSGQAATAPKDQSTVNVPPPGSPAPLPPIPTEKAAETALAETHDEKKEVTKKDKKPTGPLHKRAWAVVKKEAAHYWAGTKLLGQEIKISSKLQWKVLQGGQLTRRERRQVCRVVPRATLTSQAPPYYHRSPSSCPILGLRHYPVHGVPASCRAQAFPQHASEHVRGSARKGESLTRRDPSGH